MDRQSISLTLAAAILFSSNAQAQSTPRTLFDQLAAVGVHVVGVNPRIDSVGVDSLPLRLALEARVRKEGLVVKDHAELLRHQETPRLVLNLAGFRVDSAFFYTVTLELLEPSRLDRSGLQVFAYDWSQQVIGVTEPGLVRSAIDQAVDTLVGLFLDGRRRALSVAAR